METKSTLVIFALIAALGLVTVVAVDVILAAQEAEARGCTRSVAANASQGRCIKTSTAELTAENEEIQQEEDAEPSNEEASAEEEKEIETDEEIQEESEEE